MLIMLNQTLRTGKRIFHHNTFCLIEILRIDWTEFLSRDQTFRQQGCQTRTCLGKQREFCLRIFVTFSWCVYSVRILCLHKQLKWK